MIRTQFHARSDAGRRGEGLPVRLRFASRRGVTLVELLISMLILTIVCIAWLQIIGIQSARKEARRREAVERLSGMMDAFLYMKQSGNVSSAGYHMIMNATVISFEKDASTNIVHAMFNGDISPIGYQMCVVAEAGLPEASRFVNWDNKRWLVGRLYDRSGTVMDVGRPFFTLPVCLGF